MADTDESGLKLLSLDGGGIRGLSMLYILQIILISIKDRLKLSRVPLPCEYFDLIGGTSTGGLIALMLGRLRMSVDNAIHAYARLSKTVFSEVKRSGDGKYKATKLEAAVKEIVEQYTGDSETEILESGNSDDFCRTFVCAVPATNMNARAVSLIRSYEAPGQPPIPCSIVEAARATTAAPTFFKRATINVQGINRTYMDGGLAQNNPCDVVLQEASRLFPGRKIACIISLGTGKLPTIHIPKRGLIQRLIPVEVARALAAIATDTEKTHQDLLRRFKSRSEIYFRLNVDEGMSEVRLDEWNKLDEVAAHTEKYLESEEVKPKLEEVVKTLVESKATLSLSEATGKVSALVESRRKAERKRCPPPSRVFTGRTDVLTMMNDHFCGDANNDQLMFVLYGMGGSGKSEIMRKFVANSHISTDDCSRRFSEVIYADASSKATLDVDLANVALDKNLGDEWKDTVSWLARTREPWLLVLNNADDAEMELKPFIPQCTHGNIIITTRNEQLSSYPRSYKISRMSDEDAKALFVDRSLRTLEDDRTDKQVTELIEELDFLALGIIQAAAYLQVHPTCTLEQYLVMFRSDRRRILEKYQNIINKPEDYEKTVYTTWNISLKSLEYTHPEAVKFLYICSFFHHKNISGTMFMNAALSTSYHTHEATGPSDSTTSWVQDFLRPFRDPTAESSDNFHNTIAHLCAYSLVEVTLEQDISLHRLVQDWSRHSALTNQLDPNYSALILALSFDPFSDLNEPDTLAYTRMLLPHMQELEASLDNSLNADIAFWFNRVYYTHAWWLHAEKVGILAMETTKRVLGEEHPDTLASMRNLAETYKKQGRWMEAEGLEVTVMVVSQRLFGEGNPGTLIGMGNLAATYSMQGRWTEAEELQVTVMEMSKRMLGEEHPNTLRSMGNLAMTYAQQGQWTEAEASQMAVLETSKRVLGEEHPDTLTSMGNLASTYWRQGRWTKAEGLYVTVMVVSKRVLGEEHSDTLRSMGNLAMTYAQLIRWTEAEALQVTVVETSKRVLGEEHPDTLTSMANLAVTYSNQGRLTEADSQEVTAIEKMKRVLGEEHPDTLMKMGNLMSTYRSQSQCDEVDGLDAVATDIVTRRDETV